MRTDVPAPVLCETRAVLDTAHVGDIKGALGTIRLGAERPRGLRERLLVLLAIVGPGIIVMVGDNFKRL